MLRVFTWLGSLRFPAWVCLLCPLLASAAEEPVLLWGDTHVHSAFSFDAFLHGNMSATPDVAYRYAKGEPVVHPYHRARVQIRTPLDLLVVSDHAELLGAIPGAYKDGYHVPDAGFIDRIRFWFLTRGLRKAIDEGKGPAFFKSILPRPTDPYAAAAAWQENAIQRASDLEGALHYIPKTWKKIIATAEAHNQPGKFTAFIGWEWSSTPGGANLHRVVVTDANEETASQFLPFASSNSPYPQDLWSWLDKTSAQTGANFVAIPHNSNISKGLMFADHTLRKEPLDAAYAQARMRWERITEVTQIKGDSETHSSLSPDDEFADFEIYPWYIQIGAEEYQARPGDYIRSALRRGLELGQQLAVNPYQFGMIGSTDAHTALASAEEDNFWGKVAFDSIPENKSTEVLYPGPTGWSQSAQGLAAVWAAENTREAILDAFRRREVYATTGTRIRLRFMAGWNLRERDLRDLPGARDRGTVMGGVIGPSSRNQSGSPLFLVQALQAPDSAPLDRIQIIKGWIDSAGQSHERVIELRWAGDRRLGADGRLPALDNGLNLRTGAFDPEIGSPTLIAAWQDPEFDPGQAAFYYVRVLEVATLRHSQRDAIALGLDKADRGPQTIQERAYSSPIWYEPGL